MHPSALDFGKLFFQTYCNREKKIRVVDIGAQDVNGSLRSRCPATAEFIGVDFVSGNGVDLVLDDPYQLPFDDGSIDVVTCSSCFEHSELFWVLFLEILRVLKSDGLLYLNTPSNGYIHKYPVDCWRLYPDAGRALVTWGKRNGYTPLLIESFIGEQREGPEGRWNDFVAVIKKSDASVEIPKQLMLDKVTGFQNGWRWDQAQPLNENFFSEDIRKIQDLNNLTNSLHELVSSKDNVITALELNNRDLATTLATKEQIVEGLNEIVAAQNQQVDNLNHTLIERDSQIASINRAMTERERQIASLNRAVTELRESTSWRLTIPVRFIGRQLLRMRVILKALPYARAVCGGYQGLFRHAWQTYKSEGLQGVKRRIAFSSAPGGPLPIIGYTESSHNDYSEWVRRYDTLDEVTRSAIHKRIAAMENPPLISVVMPTYNPNPAWLTEAIESVRGQLYPHWELCIADDASPNPSIRPLLEKFAREDSRIKLVLREQNGHISAASNSALQLASGDWVALLDHDDLLAEHALYCVAASIIANPSIRMIYSDEDKINEVGRRHAPYFKCDWNPDLFYSHNMFSHLGVYHRPLLERIGRFRLGLEGSQDYDLALRCIENIDPAAIHHIPRVLYHWRVHAESTAGSADAKPYAMLAGERAINEHFLRRGIAGKVELTGHGYRANYELPEKLPLVSLIIPTRNGLHLIKKCVTSILDKTTYKNYEILIVDNNSDDLQTLAYFASLAGEHRIRVLRDERPFNYSALNNSAALQARGEYLALINNDIEVISPQWLDEMIGLAIQPGVGAVGARLWYPDDTLQHGGCITCAGGVAVHAHRHLPKGHPGYFSRAELIQTVSAVTAACLAIKKSIYQEVGGLDETNLKVAFNDVDFCLRVREAGYRNIWTPYAELYHYESATRGHEDTPEKQTRFQAEILYMKKRWGDTLLSDPAYSPNLTLDREDFSFAWPPRVEPLAD